MRIRNSEMLLHQKRSRFLFSFHSTKFSSDILFRPFEHTYFIVSCTHSHSKHRKADKNETICHWPGNKIGFMLAFCSTPTFSAFALFLASFFLRVVSPTFQRMQIVQRAQLKQQKPGRFLAVKARARISNSQPNH